MFRTLLIGFLAAFCISVCSAAEQAFDRDGDGISDAHEELLVCGGEGADFVAVGVNLAQKALALPDQDDDLGANGRAAGQVVVQLAHVGDELVGLLGDGRLPFCRQVLQRLDSANGLGGLHGHGRKVLGHDVWHH